ncbi:MAG: Tex family protein [Anaerolineae bacterium]|nr:MAG: Tex family protein [Anaerolineae bacterium]
MDHAEQIGHILELGPKQVSSAIRLLDLGNTLPFISRYRKEATSGLDEEQLRQIFGELERLRSLDNRRNVIVASIEKQEKLTPELKKMLQEANNLSLLEDLYLPYKPKRRTRGSVARQQGLEGLAKVIIKQPINRQLPEAAAAPYINEKVHNVEAALAGSRDIIAEDISDNPQIRQELRRKALRWSKLSAEKVKAADDTRGVYRTYYEFQGSVNKIRPHQILAINRGEKEKILRVKVAIPERDWRNAIGAVFRVDGRSPLSKQMMMAIDDGAKRLLLPAIERDVRRWLTEKSEEHAISVFANNLRGLLNQPPLVGFTLLGIDPGYRTGCKVAVVDPTGKLMATTTIYLAIVGGKDPTATKNLVKLIKKHEVKLIAIGNGTGSRETEELVAALITEQDVDCKYLIANEAGASVYSASALAREELPGLDVALRGAVSIARRVQDPLAELVKIDPKSIGVGLYQHDVNQNHLNRTLTGVVESVVNQVGVDINTASSSLLNYVSGIGSKLAGSIVSYRDTNGPFLNRQSIRRVPGMGPKSFEQSAGFLRIRNGAEPLDSSAIHPESYKIAKSVLGKAKCSMEMPLEDRKEALHRWSKGDSIENLALSLQSGVPTLQDILEQLIQPGRDPREDFPAPLLRMDILKIEDLKPGMKLSGTVRNVVDFGAFVDIGLKEDGLLHRSQWPVGQRPAVGDVIEVGIIKLEPERGRISLSWS